MSTTPVFAPSRPKLGAPAMFGLHPRARTRTTIALVLGVATVLTEAAGLAGWLPDLDVGRIVVSASVIPAALLTAVLGRALMGRTTRENAAVAYWACAAVALLLCMCAYRTLSHPADLAGLLLAAADEELVYRLAVPAVVGMLLCLAGVRRNLAWIFGFVVGGVWFVALPGHRSQWNDVFSILAFAAFAAVMALVVYRSGSVAAAAVAHLCADLLTILVWNDVVGRQERSALLGVVLVLLVVAYGATPRRARRTTVIDLRDGVVPSLQRGGGAPIPIIDPPTPAPNAPAAPHPAALGSPPLPAGHPTATSP